MPRRFGFGLGFNISRLSGLPEPSGFVAKYQSYDIDDFTLVTGSNVSQWDDRSSNANNLTQNTSANQPVLTQDANRFNNTVDFDSNDFMNGLPSQSGDFTYVFKGVDIPSYASINSRFVGQQGLSTARILNVSGDFRVFDDANATVFNEPWNNESVIVVRLSGNTLSVFMDSVQLGADVDVTGSSFTTITTLGNSGSSLQGTLQELYVYDRALTQDEINWFSYLRDENNNISPVPPLLPS